MIPSNTSSSVRKPSYYAKFLRPKTNNLAKSSSDRHLKVDGKDPRIRLPTECAERVFELNKKLGHRSAGQTVEWLLNEAKATVDAVLTTNPTFPPDGPRLPYSYLSRTTLDVPPISTTFSSYTKFQNVPILEGDKLSSSISRCKPELPYCYEADVEISADNVAKFLLDSSS